MITQPLICYFFPAQLCEENCSRAYNSWRAWALLVGNLETARARMG